MNKIVSKIRHSHPEVYKGILFILTICAIVYILPKQEKLKYEYQNLKGKPWSYDDLIAPFDFAIKKSASEIAKEKAEILKNSKPYFIISDSLFKFKRTQFNTNFESTWDNNKSNKLKKQTLKYANNILDSIQSKGIIENIDLLLNKKIDYSVYVLKNNVAEEKELNKFYTVKSAFQFINSQTEEHKNQIDKTFVLPLLENTITHTVVFNKNINEKVTQQLIENIAPTRDVILKNQKIISKGEIVDQNKFQILESLEFEYQNQTGGNKGYYYILLGQTIVTIISFSVLLIFLYFFRLDIFIDNKKIIFILILIVLQLLMASTSLKSESFSIYLLPFCVLPIVIRAFYDTRIALFVHLITVLLISFIAPNRFEFAFIQLLTGIVAIFSIVNMRNRSQIFISASLIFTTYCLTYFGITIIQEGGNNVISMYDFAWFGISALLTLFSYPLIFVFEKIFGFISDVSLLELSDTNGKVLRELASKAPGTFQHSLQVANIAEEAIHAIGGNALLVRAGSLYHDIGKMNMPMYFIENQANGINPHEDLNYDESASIIIGHVIQGIEIAKKNNLPEQIIDFIRTHHGTTITAYFYRSFQNAYPNEKIDESKFHYPGPIPFSKETAVLMMADSVEAASRSLKKYDAESIDNLVDSIINKQIEQNQFMNSDITFKDINLLKKIFKKKIMNIYHVRVEYPR
ncbi:MAG: HDIG domain-containing protein [Bacteroidia bacterium]|nr:HDIG domain-containing protein [Bacteroidia bacterium]